MSYYIDQDVPLNFFDENSSSDSDTSSIQGEQNDELANYTFSDISRTTLGDADTSSIILKGGGSYIDKLNKTLQLSNVEERIKIRAMLAASTYYDMSDAQSMTGILDAIKQKYPQKEYLNMGALIGAILFYRQYLKTSIVITKDNLDKFYTKYPRLANPGFKGSTYVKDDVPIITKEDLLRYIRMVIKVNSKKI